LILSTLNLHLLGSSFARTMLLEHGISNWARRGAVLALVIGLGGAVVIWARQTLPPPDVSEWQDFDALKDYFQQLLGSGPVPYLLYPFRLVVRPYLAQNAMGFLSVLGPALALLLLHYAWVVRSNVAFEEASVEASRKLAEKVAAVRAGNWQGVTRKPKSKRAPFKLRSTGFPSTALLWKNLISAGQAFTLRIWISVAAVAIGGSVGLRQSSSGSGWLTGIGLFATMLMVWSLLIGPQVLRHDFRQDLPLCDVLKLYPLRGWQVALGELLAPAVILTGIQWFLVILAAGVSSQGKAGGAGLAAGLGLGAALVLPIVNLILLVIPNAAVLLFPAWFQAGKEGAQSIEATGQRLIFLLGQVLVFLIALIPAAALFAAVFFLVKLFVLDAPVLELGLAGLAATLVLAAEAVGGVMLLGWLFERFDLSAEN
jgi:ABC-2 type transport system permease protein